MAESDWFAGKAGDHSGFLSNKRRQHMQFHRKASAFGASLLLFLATFAGECASAEPAKVMLNMGSTASPVHSYSQAADLFEEMVKKNSNGAIETKRMFGGVLGSETKMTTSVQDGSLEMGWLSDIGMSTVLPEIGFVNLPYLFPTYDDVDKLYLNGWMGEIVKKRLEAKGIHVLAWIENDYRGFTNSRRRILKSEDFKGLKVRVPEMPMFVNFFKELGVLPTPMSITEVATALQQGTVDGQDNGAILTQDFGFSKFQKYATKTKHSYSAGAIMINKKLWDGLSPERKKILQDAATSAGAQQIKANRARVEGNYQLMKADGMQIDDVTPEVHARMKAAALKIWSDKSITQKYGDDVLSRLLGTAK